MTKQILYIEDHPNNRLLVQRIVEAEGLAFLGAEDATSGWQLAVTQQTDLIFMDLHLPGTMNGLELTTALKNQPELAGTPIVALTAFGNEEAEKAAFLAGCDAFLRKPADIRQIRAVIHQFLGAPEPVTMPQSVAAFSYI